LDRGYCCAHLQVNYRVPWHCYSLHDYSLEVEDLVSFDAGDLGMNDDGSGYRGSYRGSCGQSCGRSCGRDSGRDDACLEEGGRWGMCEDGLLLSLRRRDGVRGGMGEVVV
jgi:hypothetical protein